ncbi:MAG: nuclear transport factor 2 family protein [Gemmatimonadaceae bacterium]|nr:nuclear transport factor 2 family protein [Gemmatimonadaceae bacterium]
METLYSPDIVSIEAGAPEGQSREAHGLEAVLAKGQWWSDNHEVHSAVINGPFPHDDRFIVHMKYDVTFKPTGKRFPMEEGAHYTVRDGKIVKEEFFYHMG